MTVGINQSPSGNNLKLKDLRAQKNLSQRDLARLLDVDHKVISNWERGKYSPTVDSLVSLARVLSDDPSDLEKVIGQLVLGFHESSNN